LPREIKFGRGCVKSFSPPSAAEYYLERPIVFEISLREISKTMGLSKDNLARSGMKRLSTQPLPNKIFHGEAADTPGK
jgi:hypothetical protein